MNVIEKAEYERRLLAKNSDGYSSLSNRLGLMGAKHFSRSTVQGVNGLSHLLIHQGGLAQQERMIRDKRRSLDKAVLYSYQGAFVRKQSDSESEQPPVRALMNPNKVKQDYDEKIISVGYEHGFQPGDVFEWVGTDTYWLVYLQELTELAYFRANARKCSYKIRYANENGDITTTYAAVKGPTETRIDTTQKLGKGIDNPNYSIGLLLPKTTETLKYFVRYAKFYLSDGIHNVCWRVEGVDAFSAPGIIQITAVEYYANKDEDDMQKGIVGAQVLEPIDPNLRARSTSAIGIVGDTFITPKVEVEYYYNGANQDDYKWFVKEKNLPVTIDRYIDAKGMPRIKITWTSLHSGQFELCYGNFTDYVTKTIVINSLS